MTKIEKDQMSVVILTEAYRIHATIHIQQGGRLTDFLNFHKEFMPLTDASFFSVVSGKLLFRANFSTVNRSFMVSIIPRDGIAKVGPPLPGPHA